MLRTLYSCGLIGGGVVVLMTAWLHAGPSLGQDRPLTVEGKTSVFQRVLTRPDARLHDAPTSEESDPLPPLKPLYVYERQDEWLRVGTSFSQGTRGWVASEKTVRWPHNIVAAFTEPVGRNRQVLFDKWEELQRLMRHENLVALQAELLRAADAGERLPGWATVAVEPEEFVDVRERDRFYVMPILKFREELHEVDYTPLLFMQVASLPLLESGEVQSAVGEFEAGVMFVIDTTTSMDPYIRGVRDAVAKLIDLIGESEIGERVHFGAVGFRDNPDATSGLEYRTRVIAEFDRTRSPRDFLDALDAIETAQVSSVGFNEDSFSGVHFAIREIDWAPEGRHLSGKYIILITDAGPKDSADPNAGVALGAGDLQTLASEHGIAILTVHLKTDAGAANHPYARDAYSELSRFEDHTYYYPIERGDPEAFESRIGQLFDAFQGHVVRTMEGLEDSPQSDDPALNDLGLAMWLRYLGEQSGAQAPDIISAWITDNAIERPTRRAVEPRLLLTRNELSTMAAVLEYLIDAAERSQGEREPATLFRQIRDAVSQMANDPQLVVNTDFETLGGAVGEFLEGLPYNSQIMDITEDEWLNMGTERRAIIDGLREKLAYYQEVHNDPGNWTPLSERDPDGEHVYAMPFSQLP